MVMMPTTPKLPKSLYTTQTQLFTAKCKHTVQTNTMKSN